MTKRVDILSEIVIERARQDAKWGGPEHDDEHAPGDWEHYIAGRLGSDVTKSFRRRMVEVAALAVAAIESHDRKAKP